MSERFEISGNVSQAQLLEIHSICRRHFGEQVDVRPRPRILGTEVELVSAVSGVVAAVIATISLGFQVRKETKATPWSMDKLKADVATECAKLGLPEVAIVAIVNFEALLDASKEPCKLRVRAKDGAEMYMYVFNDGSKYALTLE